MGALTEIELIEAVRRGQREGQTEMVGRYAERVFAMVVRQVPDVMDAQELTQMQFQIKAERIRMSSEKLDELYKFIKTMLNGSNLDYQMDVTFKEILKQNKEIDTKWQDAIKFAQAQSLPKLAYPILYKEILEFLQVRTVKSMTSISVVLWSRTPVRCRSTSPNTRKRT